jgi:hypothetical protein
MRGEADSHNQIAFQHAGVTPATKSQPMTGNDARAEPHHPVEAWYDFLLARLFAVDPAGITFETNTDGSEPDPNDSFPPLRNAQTF